MRLLPKLLVGVLVLAIAGCATTTPTTMAPPSVDVRGKWSGRWSFENPGAGGGEAAMELQQTGADVAGNLTLVGPTVNKSSYFEATVTGDLLVLKAPYGSGTLTVQGDEMSGIVNGIMPATVTMRRQK